MRNKLHSGSSSKILRNMKFYMGIFLVFTCFIALSFAKLSDEQIAKLVEHRKICAEQSGVDAKVVENARNGQFVNDSKLKDYLFCVSKRIGVIDDAGAIQHGIFKAKMGLMLSNQELADKLDVKCVVAKGSVKETSFETAKCFIANAPKGAAYF